MSVLVQSIVKIKKKSHKEINARKLPNINQTY